MFQDPTENASFIEPGRYIVKVAKLEAMPPNPEHPDWAPSIRWYFNLQNYSTKEVLRDPAGQELLELWQYTSTSMNTKSKARPWVEALLGRALTPSDTGAAIGQALVGAKAVAMVGPNQAGKDAILSIQPYKEPVRAKPSAAVAVLEDDLPQDQRTGAQEPEEAVAF